MFEEFIAAHRDVMVASLQGLLQIESVREAALPYCPFGNGPAAALEFMLHFAKQRGFTIYNCDGFAGHVEFGEGDEYIAVVSHLDVVPAGSGWMYPPFAAEVHDGKVFARGAIDDKGPAMSTLWALILLKELGFQPRRKIRLIFGLDEESDWRCMEAYFAGQPHPLGGFTPDADFPLIFAEKGMATFRMTARNEANLMAARVVRLEGGSRVNMVPDYACATIECHSELAAREWEQNMYKEAKAQSVDMDLTIHGTSINVVTHGVSAHASRPEDGNNAICALAKLLVTQPLANISIWRLIANFDTAGKSIGIACSDEVTGDLTANLGIARCDDNTITMDVNIRYPLDKTSSELQMSVQEFLSTKWSVQILDNMGPLHVPVDSPVVQTLLQVYRNATGDQRDPLAIGGATYARAIPNAVAFGALFPNQLDCAHQPNEFWGIDDFLRCTQIYAQAMLDLANTL